MPETTLGAQTGTRLGFRVQLIENKSLRTTRYRKSENTLGPGVFAGVRTRGRGLVRGALSERAGIRKGGIPMIRRPEPAYWKRTGFVVCLVAGSIILVFVLLGPVVYLVRVAVRYFRKGWRKVVNEWQGGSASTF